MRPHRAKQPDLRDTLAAKLRDGDAEYRSAWVSDPGTTRSLHRAERLEAGEPVDVDGWELPGRGFEPNTRYRLEPDGSVRPVEGH